MASTEEVSFFSEWECDEEEGEEAGGRLTRNDKAWNSCDKLKVDKSYHQRYMPLKDALAFRDLSTEDKEAFVKVKRLTDEDKMFLSSEQEAKPLANFSDAVVCITVEQTVSAQVYGTGFFVQLNSTEDAVITNSHSIRLSMSGSGIDFRL